MLNKKGFTIAEVVVSFGLMSVILMTLISTTLIYRDKVKSEEIITQLLDFKNTVTNVIYDDIVNKPIVKVETCVGLTNCVNLIDVNDQSHMLRIDEFSESTESIKKGVYLYYDGIRYMLPDSDLGDGNDRICDFVGGFDISDPVDNKLYKVKTTFLHKDLNISYDLLFIVN